MPETNKKTAITKYAVTGGHDDNHGILKKPALMDTNS